ncbi:uncharacterized protein LACBIDRAFT_335419 [Laccaria bicolor S238N-H82]|uniref:Predicted protein n=1 Tax=Laccaria bicolor (strain S238N-H82 / ATCC MYA-4686) TaxID=486041 RepID=B0E2A3_LACBS|nr:uncharacterized protein LACBIDRAFT_335419 [Laccaria bicolor S238N-H82]EDQ99012.1 predicted protein [Laccaria bicolor S238N-H82]|eukprot:XP_001890320.1 predicted protein [Laccaria bicolor S238N-H82]
MLWPNGGVVFRFAVCSCFDLLCTPTSQVEDNKEGRSFGAGHACWCLALIVGVGHTHLCWVQDSRAQAMLWVTNTMTRQRGSARSRGVQNICTDEKGLQNEPKNVKFR